MRKLKKVIPILILCLAMGAWLAGCAGKGAPEKTNCDADEITQTVFISVKYAH